MLHGSSYIPRITLAASGRKPAKNNSIPSERFQGIPCRPHTETREFVGRALNPLTHRRETGHCWAKTPAIPTAGWALLCKQHPEQRALPSARKNIGIPPSTIRDSRAPDPRTSQPYKRWQRGGRTQSFQTASDAFWRAVALPAKWPGNNTPPHPHAHEASLCPKGFLSGSGKTPARHETTSHTIVANRFIEENLQRRFLFA